MGLRQHLRVLSVPSVSLYTIVVIIRNPPAITSKVEIFINLNILPNFLIYILYKYVCVLYERD